MKVGAAAVRPQRPQLLPYVPKLPGQQKRQDSPSDTESEASSHRRRPPSKDPRRAAPASPTIDEETVIVSPVGVNHPGFVGPRPAAEEGQGAIPVGSEQKKDEGQLALEDAKENDVEGKEEKDKNAEPPALSTQAADVQAGASTSASSGLASSSNVTSSVQSITDNLGDVAFDGNTIIVGIVEELFNRGQLVLVPPELLDGKQLGDVRLLMVGTLSELVF